MVGLNPVRLKELIYGKGLPPRYTQDSPTLPSVWSEFGRDPSARVDLLLTPHRNARPGELAVAIRRRFSELGDDTIAESHLTFNDSYVVGKFTFVDLCSILLPLTTWFRDYLWIGDREQGASPRKLRRSLHELIDDRRDEIISAIAEPPGSEAKPRDTQLPADLVWLIRIAGVLEMVRRGREPYPGDTDRLTKHRSEEVWEAFRSVVPKDVQPEETTPPLWLVDINRRGKIAVWRSRQTTKADAAERTFAPDYGGIKWAIIDTGIDATHPAFRRRDKDGKVKGDADLDITTDWARDTRIVRSYDFTKIRPLLTESFEHPIIRGLSPASRDKLADLRTALEHGRSIDWDLLTRVFEVPHDRTYKPPKIEHGTHVAGILAADWRADDPDMPEKSNVKGICSTLELMDLRVFDDDGTCDEFSVIGALQFIRFLNARSDQPVVHGVTSACRFLPNRVTMRPVGPPSARNANASSTMVSWWLWPRETPASTRP